MTECFKFAAFAMKNFAMKRCVTVDAHHSMFINQVFHYLSKGWKMYCKKGHCSLTSTLSRSSCFWCCHGLCIPIGMVRYSSLKNIPWNNAYESPKPPKRCCAICFCDEYAFVPPYSFAISSNHIISNEKREASYAVGKGSCIFLNIIPKYQSSL